MDLIFLSNLVHAESNPFCVGPYRLYIEYVSLIRFDMTLSVSVYLSFNIKKVIFCVFLCIESQFRVSF